MSKGRKIFTAIFALIIGFGLGFATWGYSTFPTEFGDVYVSGNLKIHFIELGNDNSGDCTLIQVGNTDVLIDAGSDFDSFDDIDSYLEANVSDGILEYVIVTHAHADHYANFTSPVNIFTEYQVNTIIDFALSNNVGKTQYENYITQRDLEVSNGAVRYSAADCIRGENGAQNVYELGNHIELKILDSYYYYNTSSSENNYSVCVLISQGERHFLFTGDLEEAGEKKLIEMNDLPQVELYKAGHHGSITSSCDELMAVIKPKIVVVPCVAGNDEYTDNPLNQFPSQEFIDNIAPYTDDVYVTSIGADGYVDEDGNEPFNGHIVVTSSKKGVVVDGSNNETLLKDSTWFIENRTMPEAWK